MSREKKLFKALFVSGDSQYHLCLGIANISPNKREAVKILETMQKTSSS